MSENLDDLELELTEADKLVIEELEKSLKANEEIFKKFRGLKD